MAEKQSRLYPLDRIRNKSAGRTSINSVRFSAFAEQNISERSEADLYLLEGEDNG